MSIFDFIQNRRIANQRFWLFLLSFIVWIFCFRGFLLDKLWLESDAISYYEHIQIILKAWGTALFRYGPFLVRWLANSFFLGRMGPYNPFLLLIFIFKMFCPTR